MIHVVFSEMMNIFHKILCASILSLMFLKFVWIAKNNEILSVFFFFFFFISFSKWRSLNVNMPETSPSKRHKNRETKYMPNWIAERPQRTWTQLRNYVYTIHNTHYTLHTTHNTCTGTIFENIHKSIAMGKVNSKML